MQPKKQLKVQYIGIFEEIYSFYWPKMHFFQLKVQYMGIFEEIDSFYWPKMHFFRAMPERKRFFQLMSSLISVVFYFDFYLQQ